MNVVPGTSLRLSVIQGNIASTCQSNQMALIQHYDAKTLVMNTEMSHRDFIHVLIQAVNMSDAAPLNFFAAPSGHSGYCSLNTSGHASYFNITMLLAAHEK